MSSAQTFEKMIGLTTESMSDFMIKHKIFNVAKIAQKIGMTREYARQLTNKNGIDFKEARKRAVLAVYYNDLFSNGLEGEKWKPIKIEGKETAHEYFVSTHGRICRKITVTKHGVSFETLKLLTNSPDSKNRMRVNITLKDKNGGKNISRTEYVNTLVAYAFLKVPKETPRYVRFKDEDYSNVFYENLYFDTEFRPHKSRKIFAKENA